MAEVWGELNRTILIVDDDTGSVRKLQELLERRGFFILVARSKQEALEALATCRSDLMVLDLEKPHLEGRQILTALRADEGNRHLPVIVSREGPPPRKGPRGFGGGQMILSASRLIPRSSPLEPKSGCGSVVSGRKPWPRTAPSPPFMLSPLR